MGKIHWRRDRLPTPVFLGFLVAQLVKNPPTTSETWVRSLGWEDALEKERLPTPVFWPGEFHQLYSPWGCKESDTTERISLSHLEKPRQAEESSFHKGSRCFIKGAGGRVCTYKGGKMTTRPPAWRRVQEVRCPPAGLIWDQDTVTSGHHRKPVGSQSLNVQLLQHASHSSV